MAYISWESPASRIILEAVLDVLADAGYHGLTLEAVQLRAGSVGEILPTTDLDDLVVIALQPLCLFQAPEPTGSLRGDLEALLRPWLGGRRREDTIIAGLLSAAEWNGKLRDAVHGCFDRPLGAAVGTVLSRNFGPGQISESGVQTLNWVLRGLALNRLRARHSRTRVDIDRLIALLVAGLPGEDQEGTATGRVRAAADRSGTTGAAP